MTSNADSSVRVVVRIRPQMPSEKIDMCEVCTHVLPDLNQISLGEGRSFTFDSVCDLDSYQTKVYELCALDLINGLFEGYNATLIAYGQTGSGKTFTMGTSFDLNIEPSNVGIIPRAMDQLFFSIEERKRKNEEVGLPRPEFSVSAQFMELYNEEIFDLLSPSNDKTKKSGIKIHEDGNSNICVVGLNSYKINSKEDAMECLKIGTLSRSTASTNMNVQSSRSHAIFSIFVQQKRYIRAKKVANEDDEEGKRVQCTGNGHECDNDVAGDHFDDDGEVIVEVLNAKFNFVDLAGSERLKRTGATGDRAKEGISINCGLLALGNVISALGDLAKIGCHVPYRDSKLTRILQDSLGGNSHTTMIACISPSDRDFMETLNTLKYANRARNIRNKVSVNKDMSRDQLIQTLRTEVASLRRQLQALKGDQIDDEVQNDLINENRMLLSQNRDLNSKLKAISLTIDDVTARNVQLQLERDTAIMMRRTSGGDVNENEEKLQEVLKGYIQEAETCRSKLVMAERHLTNLSSVTPSGHRSSDVMSRSMTCYPSSDQSLSFLNRSDDIIRQAKQDVQNLTKLKQQKENSKRERSRSERKSENETTETSASSCYDDLNITVDEDDEGDEDSLGEGSDTEIENAEDLEGNLAELSCEISIKQKLIYELIESQKRVRLLKQQYEEKIYNLEEKIKLTELERDRVFQGIGDKKGSKEDSKKLKKDYEDKLNEMREKLLKLNAAKREHKKLMVSQGNYERRLNTLQNEMAELKRIKVKLMRQLEEEAQRRRQSEQRMKKEMATMQKLQRSKDVQLKNLELEKKKKDVVLKRKIQEVEALKKKEKFLCDKKLAASKMRACKGKKVLPWDRIEKLIESSISKRQALKHLARDMEKWMKQREHLCRKLDHLTEKLRQAESKEEDASDLLEEIERIRKNMNVTQDSIHSCQKCIMNFEENKDDDLESLLSNCSMGDILYFLERCTSLVINKGVLVVQKEEERRELQAQLEQERAENRLNVEMVEKLIREKVEVQVEHGVIEDLDGTIDRCPTPPLILMDSLEDAECHNGNNWKHGFNVPLVTTSDTRHSTIPDNQRTDTYRLDSSDEGIGSIIESDSNFATPSPKLHLLHCWTAIGHTKAVLSLHATRNKLYSSGKDACVKVWDLEKGCLVTSLDDNPGSVVRVRHLESAGLTLAASAYVVKVFDARMKSCVAVLTSSGLTIDQSQLGSGSMVSCPPGEMNINSIATNHCGSLFLSGAGNFVRIWDTRMFKPISKLHGGHQCSITTMSLIDVNQSTALVATGSKDNSIRVYSLGSKELSNPSISPRICMTSCHSDNIESLCFNGVNHLYSGARDMTISKWDLSGGGQHRQTVQNAHRSWVTSMILSETNLQQNSSLSLCGWLLSGCQSGTLRLWSASNLTLLSEYRSAHQGAINSVVVGGSSSGDLWPMADQKRSQQFVFTASNDKTINIWRSKGTDDK